jgi:cytochrome c oxidase cbb3-type subunit I/II
MKNSFDVPYTKAEIDSAQSWADNQAKKIVKDIYKESPDIKESLEKEAKAKGGNFVPLEKREIVSLISYLQRLGTDIKTSEVKTASNN